METVVCCYMATQITQIKKIDNVNAEEEWSRLNFQTHLMWVQSGITCLQHFFLS